MGPMTEEAVRELMKPVLALPINWEEAMIKRAQVKYRVVVVSVVLLQLALQGPPVIRVLLEGGEGTRRNRPDPFLIRMRMDSSIGWPFSPFGSFTISGRWSYDSPFLNYNKETILAYGTCATDWATPLT